MRAQPKRTPYPVYRHAAQAAALGHLTGAPVSGAFGLGLQRANHNLFHPLIGNLPRCSRAGFVEQPIKPLGDEAPPPFAGHRRADAQLARHRFVVATGSAVQSGRASPTAVPLYPAERNAPAPTFPHHSTPTPPLGVRSA